MFGSGVLDVAIGLVFLYLLSSLICSAINELISGIVSSRAKTLVSGLSNLLDGKTAFTNPKDAKTPTNSIALNNWTKKLLNHPLVDAMGADASPPSYLPARTFSTALLSMIMDASGGERAVTDLNLLKGLQVFEMLQDKTSKLDNTVLNKALPPLIEAARTQWAAQGSPIGAEVATVKNQIESWFNDAMDRVSGWYKRKTQVSIFIISIIGVLVLNIDSISAVQRLGSDSTFRAAVASGAQAYVKSNSSAATTAPQEDPEQQLATLDQYQYPIGWKTAPLPAHGAKMSEEFGFWLQKVIGLLISAAAISLGAPFWFDILSRFISIRSTGKAVTTS